jgi:hypothetical protein
MGRESVGGKAWEGYVKDYSKLTDGSKGVLGFPYEG